MVLALPHVPGSLGPHHPDSLVAGAEGGSRMVAVLTSRALEPAALTDTEIADELIRRRAEIDRLEAEFAQPAYAGRRRGIGPADGSPSTQAWLRRHTGMREGEPRAAIESGSVSELLPTI